MLVDPLLGVMLCCLVLKFVMFERRELHVYFRQSPTGYVVGPVYIKFSACCLLHGSHKIMITNLSSSSLPPAYDYKIQASSVFFFYFKKRLYLFIFREGKGGREKSTCGCLSSAPYWGPGPRAGMCPDREWNPLMQRPN